MSIRVKLILTYTILLIISASVLFFTGMAVVVGFFTETADVFLKDKHIGAVFDEVIDLLAELKQAEDYEPDKLIRHDFIRQLNENLDFMNGGLIVKQGDTYINYSELPEDEAFYSHLVMLHSAPDVDYEEMDDEKVAFQYGKSNYFYYDTAFDVKDEEVLYFFVFDVSAFEDLGKQGGRRFFGGLFIILVIIMSPLLIISTNDIIKPLKTLEYGVKNIKEGNLDFKLETKKRNEIGRVIQYFDVMRQELKKSIETQVQYEDNRKELISSISHDLKTPITSIKGHVEGIRDGVANTPEKMEKYLNVIYQKSKDMDQLIDDLFLFSKFDLERVPFDMSDVRIVDLLDEAVNEMRLEWEDENRKLAFKISDDSLRMVKVLMDQQHMKRVLVNLIHNSMKFMDKEKQEIQVQLNDNGEYVQIIVSDNGMGIEEAHLDHIFNRFYRADESRNTSRSGTGLGLAITKQIVEQHQGHIFVSSVFGQGTKMVVELKKSENQKAGLNLEKESADY